MGSGTSPHATARERLHLMAQAKQELEKKRVRFELPHLFGFPPYQWTVDYWNSTARMKFICAGNQLSKSSTQIRHCIDIATNKSKWAMYAPKWVDENPGVPPVAWYIYPNKGKILEEFDKWEREFLPRGTMKNDPAYGWKLEKDKDGTPMKLSFRTGFTVWFRSWYHDLQAGTLAFLFIDEECPAEGQNAIWGELMARVTRYDGMVSMCFTATLNQPFFFDVIERIGQKDERFPEAFKRQVSMEYDCEFYADGTRSPWTPEEVAKQKAKMGTEIEINRRVHGRFVSNVGRKFPSFNRRRHVLPAAPVNRDWDFYVGVDPGTGGAGHPAGIAVVAVNKEAKFARAIRLWRGNSEENTNSSQVLQKYIDLTSDLPITRSYYDWHNKEFFLRAQDAGIPFSKAEKGQEFGTDLLNTLWKNDMLIIDEGEFSDELATEIENLRHETAKTKAKDDLTDALRYAISKVQFDFSGVTGVASFFEPKIENYIPTQEEMRAGFRSPHEVEQAEQAEYDFENELDFYNDLME
jgi:hypothetical protein